MSERHQNILDQIDHSKTDERYATGQVTKIFHNASILPGDAQMTKREAMNMNRENGAKQSHEVHQNSPISWNTYHTYKSATIPLATFARVEFGIRDLYQLTPKVVSEYLLKVSSTDIKFETFDKNCSAISKLCECINSHNEENGGERQDFYKVIVDYRESASETMQHADYLPRTYENPSEIASHLPENMQITAELQYSCGLRVSDACYITPQMWDGEKLTVHSKNGQYHTVTPNAELASKITNVIQTEGKLSVNLNAYDYRLEKACGATGEKFEGSHGFRHYFAQSMMSYYTTEKGLTFNQALQKVSELMGHHRPEITKWYLR